MSRLVYVAVGAIVAVEVARDQIAQKIEKALTDQLGQTPQIKAASKAAGAAFASKLDAFSVVRVVVAGLQSPKCPPGCR